MNPNHLIRLFISATAMALLAGCATTSPHSAVDYLNAPAAVRLGIPVFLVIHDQRPAVERSGDPTGAYRYTMDGPDKNGAANALGIDICRVMEQKVISPHARVVVAGEVPPPDGFIIQINLTSWYGRLPGTPVATPSVEGRCRFSSIVTYGGKQLSLGVSTGRVVHKVLQTATIPNEGNLASAAASDQAITQFLQTLEKRLAK